MSFASIRPVPERLGRYRLQEVIGEGSMGVVYLARDLDIDRPVALKTMRRDRNGDAIDHSEAHFRHEAQAVGSLSHPGIVSIHEYGMETDYAYIAMEYVEGSTLRVRMEEDLTLAVPVVVDVMSQLLDALHYAHGRGVWHRDVKPANILLTRDGAVKLADFGIAYRQDQPSIDAEILGSPGFVAPELYLSNTFDSRIDVFAAGAVLYLLLTGSPPYVGRACDIMLKVLYETPLPPSIACGRADIRPYDSVVLRAMARRPEDRFATAAHFRTALLQSR